MKTDSLAIMDYAPAACATVACWAFERFIYALCPLMHMITGVPKSFWEKVIQTKLQMEGARRHLMLMRHEGLYLLERWRAERDWYWQEMDSRPKYI